MSWERDIDKKWAFMVEIGVGFILYIWNPKIVTDNKKQNITKPKKKKKKKNLIVSHVLNQWNAFQFFRHKQF